MQGDRERLEPEFRGEAEFAEAEEIFVQVLGKVAADELLAAVLEGAGAVGASLFAERGSLEASVSTQSHASVAEEWAPTNKSARCAFILSCTTPSFVANLSTSSRT